MKCYVFMPYRDKRTDGLAIATASVAVTISLAMAAFELETRA